jgi:alpha-tubulin suppressor-like RCC1 family protein
MRIKLIFIFLVFSFETSKLFAQVGCWEKISVGVSFSLAIKNDGTLWAWGYNDSGQLGDSTNTSKTIPTRIGKENDWQQISCGGSQTIAIKNNGTLWAWGENNVGQLGDSSIFNKNSPTKIGNANDWNSISTGIAHSMAIKKDSTLWGWGFNLHGQLSYGATVIVRSPVKIGNAKDWKQVSAGATHTIAIKYNGTIWACGDNASGQLGNGRNFGAETYMTQIGSSKEWIQVDAGDYYNLALKSDGSLWAWGANDYGQLGDSTNTIKTIPTRVGTQNDWKQIFAGVNVSFALKNDGTLWVWGNVPMYNNTPTRINTDQDWMAVSHNYHILTLKNNGMILAWGNNQSGELGDGTTENKNIPTPIDCPMITSTKDVSQYERSFLIFHNPFENSIHIQSINNPISKFQLFDLFGKLVKQEIVNQQSTFDFKIDNYANGIYILIISNQKTRESFKVILN